MMQSRRSVPEDIGFPGQERKMEEKTKVRTVCRSIRGKMSPEEVFDKSRRIDERLMALPCIQKAPQILVYAAVRGEVEVSLFAEEMLRMGKTVAFPRVSGKTMEFYEVNSLRQLRLGSFRIPEPDGNGKPVIPEAGAIICVPGTAFAEDGSRIGQGGGYYDRYLSRYPYLYRIGLAYEWQTRYAWEADATDMPVHLLVTEEHVICTDRTGKQNL